MVVCGCNQKEGIGFNESFSLIIHHTSLGMFLASVALFDLDLDQVDLKIAFTLGELEAEIYVR